jgi:hypothetical protein
MGVSGFRDRKAGSFGDIGTFSLMVTETVISVFAVFEARDLPPLRFQP